MMEIILAIVAFVALSQKRTVSAANAPAAPVSPLSNALLQQLLAKQQASSGGGKGSGGGGMGGGGSPSGAGRSAGNYPPLGDPSLVTPTSYSDPTTNAYQEAYNQYYGADPTAPTGASGAIGTVPGTGGPGDVSTAESAITQDPTLAGILQAPVGNVVLAPQPDTNSDVNASDGSGQTAGVVDDGTNSGYAPATDSSNNVASASPDPSSGFIDNSSLPQPLPDFSGDQSVYDSGNGYGGDPYADF